MYKERLNPLIFDQNGQEYHSTLNFWGNPCIVIRSLEATGCYDQVVVIRYNIRDNFYVYDDGVSGHLAKTGLTTFWGAPDDYYYLDKNDCTQTLADKQLSEWL